MNVASEGITTLPHVEGELHYLAPMTEKPFTYTYDPPPGTPRSNIVSAAYPVPIHNARPIASDLSLDREGFRLVSHQSAVHDFYDQAAVKSIYYPEAEQLVAEATGAARVIVFDHTIRRRVPGVEDRSPGTPRQPVPRVHNDYTEVSGPQRLRDLLDDEAEQWLDRRFEIINVWRPIRGPLRDAPLAVCDARTVAAPELVGTDLIYRDRKGEIYSVSYSPRHRWFYIPDMQADEALLLKCYDWPAASPSRFAPHTAFEDKSATDVLPRESIELRTLVLHSA
jgi:hypothetical protein